MTNIDPLQDIRDLIKALPEIDHEAVKIKREREGKLTKPAGALGRLEELSEWLAGWSGRPVPFLNKPMVVVFATGHGVAMRGVSAFPSKVNQQMLDNFDEGGAAINQICKTYGLGLKIIDLAVEHPSPDITLQDAMTIRECAATIAYGMEAIAQNVDLLCLGEMGIGNTTIAAALYYALWGGEAKDWVGRGTGIDDDRMSKKVAAVEQAVARLGNETKDPLSILCAIGGREIAAMCGAIVAARMERIPVVLDGFVTTAAAAILKKINPAAIDHCIAGHCSAEMAHVRVLKRLGLEPLLNLEMRLGEGTGAALAAGILQAAVCCHAEMATFDEAGVSRKN